MNESVKKLLSKKAEPAKPVKIVDSENDFPFAKVHRIFVGSGHAEASTQDKQDALLRLMQKLVDSFHGETSPQPVEIVHKS